MGVREISVNATERKVLDYIEIHRDEIVDFVRGLIKYKTYNPQNPGDPVYETKECQEFIDRKLREMGLETELYEPDMEAIDKKYKGTPNYIPNRIFCLKDRPQLWSRLKGSGGGKSMILVGHIDTVPAEPIEAWKHDPFEAEVEDGRVYGRGAADMKGGVAAMIKALEFVERAGLRLKGDVQVWSVNEEEVGSMGSFVLVDKFLVEKGYEADGVMVPECTGMEIVTALRGIIFGKMTVKGVSGHAEGTKHPHWSQGGAVSAIHKAFKIFSAISELNNEWYVHPRKQHPLYQCWRTVPPACWVTMISGGSAPNTFAGDCTMTYDIQYNPNEKGEDVIREFEEYILKICETDSWLKHSPPKFEWGISVIPYETSTDDPIVKNLIDATKVVGHEPTVVGAPWYCDAGPIVLRTKVPAVVFGPGYAEFAHKPDERVSIEQMVECCKAYALALLRWCGTS